MNEKQYLILTFLSILLVIVASISVLMYTPKENIKFKNIVVNNTRAITYKKNDVNIVLYNSKPITIIIEIVKVDNNNIIKIIKR